MKRERERERERRRKKLTFNFSGDWLRQKGNNYYPFIEKWSEMNISISTFYNSSQIKILYLKIECEHFVGIHAHM